MVAWPKTAILGVVMSRVAGEPRVRAHPWSWSLNDRDDRYLSARAAAFHDRYALFGSFDIWETSTFRDGTWTYASDSERQPIRKARQGAVEFLDVQPLGRGALWDT